MLAWFPGFTKYVSQLCKIGKEANSATRSSMQTQTVDEAAHPRTPRRAPPVVRMRGGMGNQMFQYAAALGVAIRNGMPLISTLMTGFARDVYERSYRLQYFRLSGRMFPRGNAAAFCRKPATSWGCIVNTGSAAGETVPQIF